MSASPTPDPIDLTKVLAIAYTDLNRNVAPDAGDVMIAQLVDTDASEDAWPSMPEVVACSGRR